MKFASDLVKGISPYTPGEQPRDKKYIKLNTNENPYPPSPKVKALLENFDTDRLRLYPDPEARALRAAAALIYGLDAENIFIGNGSDEVLAFCFPAFFNPGDSVACYDLTYSFYPVYAKLFGVCYKEIKLIDYKPDLSSLMGVGAKGLLLANPNTPTAVALKKEEMEAVIKSNADKIVIVDEAYIDFCAESVTDLIPYYPNLLIVRTLSKSYSLAGARCGMALGHKSLIAALNTVKNSFNSYTSSALSLAVAEEAIKDEKWHKECVLKVTKIRDTVSQRLNEMGFELTNSSSNFLFVKVGEGEKYYLALKQKGILVRFFNTSKLREHIRVTIGHFEDMVRFLEAMTEIKESLDCASV
ncbi:MAG: histidinol-phosphate transaminase [Christensenellales bacterium]|jgi:histidinol-phosphate aminotransferase